MKTFALVMGDLSPAAGGYLMYDGTKKIHQDLALALQEEYGGDPIHPRWGSILQNYIGVPLTQDTLNKVLSEINRVLSNYVTLQNAQIVVSSNNGTLSQLGADDVVQSITSISAQQVFDSLLVNVALQTVSRQSINISQVIS